MAPHERRMNDTIRAMQEVLLCVAPSLSEHRNQSARENPATPVAEVMSTPVNIAMPERFFNAV